MTLGEKIRYARKCCGLSQEQLAERICVSRSAIAKWETDKGMPDIENLKMLSRLLQVSVDSLLNDSTAVIREPINLSAYGRGCEKVKRDRLMRQRFPGAKIWPLLGRPELTDQENTLDSTLGFLTPAPFGTPEFMKSLRDIDKAFYLVEQIADQFFVTVTDDCLELHPLPQRQAEQTFRLGSWSFIRCEYLAEE